MQENIEYYYDHYKDSFEQVKLHLKNRDRLFIFAAIALFASIFISFNPAYIQDKSNAIGKLQLGIDLDLTFYAINSIVLFFSLWLLLRYYQTVLIIENLYLYLRNVEDNLCSLISDYKIDREGKSYLNSYPILKSCIHSFYSIVFPALVIIFILTKGYLEIFDESLSIPLIALVFDILSIVIIIIMTFLYLSWIHFKDFRKKK